MSQRLAEGGARLRPRFVFGWALRFALGLAPLALLPGVAAGHEGPARIIVEPPNVNPGGTIVVRGEDLSAELELALAIVGANARAELDIERTDVEGHFTQFVVIPYDIAPGRYAFEAAAATGELYRAEVVVAGEPPA